MISLVVKCMWKERAVCLLRQGARGFVESWLDWITSDMYMKEWFQTDGLKNRHTHDKVYHPSLSSTSSKVEMRHGGPQYVGVTLQTTGEPGFRRVELLVNHRLGPYYTYIHVPHRDSVNVVFVKNCWKIISTFQSPFSFLEKSMCGRRNLFPSHHL